MTHTISTETQHTSGVYAKRDLTIVRGEGAILWDDTGNEYIDCVGAQGAANLGHAHPKIVQAIHEQASQLISCPEMFYNPQRAACMRPPDGLSSRKNGARLLVQLGNRSY